MPLKISLKADETFVVNGAIVVNGNRRVDLLFQNQARVIREKDMFPEKDKDLSPLHKIAYNAYQHAAGFKSSRPAEDRGSFEDLSRQFPEFNNENTWYRWYMYLNQLVKTESN